MLDTKKDLNDIKVPIVNQDLANYIQQFQKDITVNIQNLREKSLTCSAIWAKWLSFLYVEKENAERIQELKQKILQKKLNSSKNINDSVLRLKSEEKISENDENIKKLNNLAKLTQTKIDYLERCLNILSNFGYQIRSCLEIVKLNLEH